MGTGYHLGEEVAILKMVRKVVIGSEIDGGWYGSHGMDRLGSLREENS